MAMTRSRRGQGLLLAATLCLGLLAGCASLDVQVDHDGYTDFSRFRTYAWADKEPTAVDPRVDNDLLAARVRRAVDTELRKAGYQIVDEGDPDFYVTYQSVVDKELDARSYYSDFPSYRYGGTPGIGYGYGSIREIAVGTLMIDILDGEEQKLVWRGSAQARLDEDWSPEERTEHINRAVSEILERFPPKR